MKKLIYLLCLILTISLTACSSNDDTKANSNTGDQSLVGFWYLNGDNSSDTYIQLNTDGSYKRCEDGDIEEGEYTVGQCNNAAPDINGTSVGDSFTTDQVEFDDIYLYTDGTLVADQCAMISDDEYYIHESALENQDVYLMANLVARVWKNIENSNERYYFYLNNSFAYVSNVEEEITDYTGTWTLEGNILTISCQTGETKIAILEVEGAHAIMSFENESATFSDKVAWED